MDQISILSIVLVSFPEAIVISLLGILSIGKFNYLKDKSNYIRIFLFGLIVSVLAYFIRRIVSNDVENILVYIFLICLLFVFIIRFNFYESILATLFASILFIVSEAICLVPISSIIGSPITNAYVSDLFRFFISIPERIIQSILILISIQYSIKIVDMESKNLNKKEFIIQLIVYILSSCTFIFLAVLMSRILIYGTNDITSSTSILLLRFNIYLTLFVTIVLTLSIRTISEFNKNKKTLSDDELRQSLDYISSLLETNKTSEAKDAVISLKTYIKTHKNN